MYRCTMDFKTIGIVGSGIMGAGIAETAIEVGYNVVLRSRDIKTAAAMVDQVKKSLDKKVAKGTHTTDEVERFLAYLRPTSELSELSDCELVIESVVENMEIKIHTFRELDKVCKPTTILATNTSTLPVIELAASTTRPSQVCGIHFFNPAPVMSLVEIVHTLVSSSETIETAKQFAIRCGKEPIEVKDKAGFVVNALLFPYLNNAVKLLEQGVATKEAIDSAMKGGCGFPMGPFALLDLVGLDTSLSILESLYDESKDPNLSPATLLKRMVAAKMLGRKTKLGFYNY